MSTHTRLNEVFKSAKVIPFNDSSKFILFSDCHRGDGSWADDFAHNQALFFHALRHYYREGFVYIEIGDGDELFENRSFEEIRQAHNDVFELLRDFHNEKRLHLIWGNHDLVRRNPKTVAKDLHWYYDERKGKTLPLLRGIEVREGLLLKYEPTHDQIFLVHGHQGEFFNDSLWWLSRFLVRYFWKPLQSFGFNDPTRPAKNFRKRHKREKAIEAWIKSRDNQMTICGHTHRSMFPSLGMPLYFNAGSCVHPRCITGIEIQDGSITLIKWYVGLGEDEIEGSALRVEKQVLAGPVSLWDFFEHRRQKHFLPKTETSSNNGKQNQLF